MNSERESTVVAPNSSSEIVAVEYQSFMPLDNVTMKILGIKIRREPFTDEEYVEGIRKVVARSKKSAASHAFFALVFLGATLCVFGFIEKAEALVAQDGRSMGTFVGFMLGAVAGFQFMLIVQSLTWAVQRWSGLRTEKLLLRYHDELSPACSANP